MKGGRFSMAMLFGTVLAGLIYGVIGEFIFRVLHVLIPNVLVTVIYFTGLFLFLGLAVFVISQLIYSSTSSRINVGQWVISFLLVVFLSAGFEFLYDLPQPGGETSGDFDSFIFVMDRSGSMDMNDPTGKTFDAIDSLISTKDDDFEYALYTFSDGTELIREMSPKGNGVNYSKPENYGNTNMLDALTVVYNDIQSGTTPLVGNSRVILLSDGIPSDINFFGGRSELRDLLEQYSAMNLSISTIGLDVNTPVLSQIATKTAGTYICVDDVTGLDEAMEKAGKANTYERNLVDYRDANFMTVLLSIMRILFVAVIGVLIAVEKAVLCEKFMDTKSVLFSSAICGILAGICIEVGMNMLGVNPLIMRVLTCMLIGFTLLRQDLLMQSSRNSAVNDVW